MTPTEKDAMALAVLAVGAQHLRNAKNIKACHLGDVASELGQARAHLASRISELVAERNEYRVGAEIARGMLARAEAELAAVREDAERYRWLRNNGFGFVHDEEHRGISIMRWGDWPYDTDEGHAAVCDAAVDAARGGVK